MHPSLLTAAEWYADDLEIAHGRLAGLAPLGPAPDGEAAKARADALNNAWEEGLTMSEWVARAARLLGYHHHA